MEIEKLKRKDSKEKEDEIQKIEEDENTVLDFSVKNDQCALRIYDTEKFMGRFVSIEENRRNTVYLFYGNQMKSMKSEGSCCWAIFRRRRFKGRPIIVGSHLRMSATDGLFRGKRNKIRSVKMLPSSQCS